MTSDDTLTPTLTPHPITPSITLSNHRHMVFKHLQHEKQLADAAEAAAEAAKAKSCKEAEPPSTAAGRRKAGDSLLSLRHVSRMRALAPTAASAAEAARPPHRRRCPLNYSRDLK